MLYWAWLVVCVQLTVQGGGMYWKVEEELVILIGLTVICWVVVY